MKIVKDVPPNFEAICTRFPFVKEHVNDIVFTYGDTLYTPGGAPVRDHLMAHEMTHTVQQGNDPAKWWERYLKDDFFRLTMEVEAYAQQYRFVKGEVNREESRSFLTMISKHLSSPIYGNICSFDRAKELIKNAAAN